MEDEETDKPEGEVSETVIIDGEVTETPSPEDPPETLQELPSWAASLEERLSLAMQSSFQTVERQLSDLQSQILTMAQQRASTEPNPMETEPQPMEPPKATEKTETEATDSTQTEDPGSEPQKEPPKRAKWAPKYRSI